MRHALIVVPLVVLLLELFMHPQVYRSQRERQQLSISALLSTQNERLGTVKAHRIHASLDDIADAAPFAHLRERRSGLVVSAFLRDEQVLSGALADAVLKKLRGASPADARALIDLLAQKTALRAGDVLRFTLQQGRTDPGAFPPGRVYLVLLDKGSPVSTDALQAGLRKAIEYAKDDGLAALVVPCLGTSWTDRDNLPLSDFFASFFASIPEHDAPDLYLSLYRNWPTFQLEDAVRALNAAWQANFDTSDKLRINLNRLELRAGLLLWSVCLLVSAFRAPLTVKNFLIISAAFGSLGVASNAGVALLASAYPSLGTLISVGILAIMAIGFPFVVHWSPKDVFAGPAQP